MKSIILAIILAESGFNPAAYNKKGNATGLMQLTPIGVKEASKQCKLPSIPDLKDPETNIKYGTCLFNYYRKESNTDVEALILYHGGYKARERFRKGRAYGKKTANYVAKVLHYQERFKNEEITTRIYCNKYPSLPESICKGEDSGTRK